MRKMCAAKKHLTPTSMADFSLVPIAKNGRAPTMQELGLLLGLRSKTWAYYLLVSLKKKGYVVMGRGARMIRIMQMPRKEEDSPPD